MTSEGANFPVALELVGRNTEMIVVVVVEEEGLVG